LSWKVEGENINVQLSPYGDVDLSGSKELTANLATPSPIEIKVTDQFGHTARKGFSIKVTPPPSPSPLPSLNVTPQAPSSSPTAPKDQSL